VVIDESDDDDSPRETVWLIRDQIDYESLAESNQRHNEFFNKASIDDEIRAKLNEYILTLSDKVVREAIDYRAIDPTNIKKNITKKIWKYTKQL
jgi:hypothetical protein